MLVIGSRGSALALWQARFIASQLAARGVETRIEVIRTTGDHLQTASLVQAGGKGLFTKEIEQALHAGGIDIAVHSLKDLPTEHPRGLKVAAIPEREDARDAVIGAPLAQLPFGARVGTSSDRRGAQLRLLRPDLIIQPIRGNIDTRLRKLDAGEFDAILLAVAGLRRLGLASRVAQLLTPHEVCPAPGQGALAVQTRDSGEALDICMDLNHPDTNDCVTAERLVLAKLGGGCQLPIGVHAELLGGELKIHAVAIAPDSSISLKVTRTGPRIEFAKLSGAVASELLDRGAGAILTADTVS